MNRSFRLLLPLLCLGVALTGCDGFESEAPSRLSADASSASITDPVTLNGYTIEFRGMTSLPGGGTTFSYRVTGVNPSPPALDWFFLETCGTPTTFVPRNAVELTEIEGISGVKWNQSLGVKKTRDYAYTFASASLGTARVAIQRGGELKMTTIPGPCAPPTALLAGSVFVDANGNGDRDAGTELGINNVLVKIFQGSVLVSSVITGSDGAFSVELPHGDYRVEVPTSGTGVFNAQLYSSYVYSAGDPPAQEVVELDGDVNGVNFGFSPNVTQILEDLTTGNFVTEARSVKFWRKALHFAVQNNWKDATNNPGTRICDPVTEICRDDLAPILDEIFFQDGEGPGEYLFLEHPYRLSPGVDKYRAAYDILRAEATEPWEIVFQNLMAIELNYLNSWGTGNDAYDRVLLRYFEGWVKQNDPDNALGTLSIGTMSLGGGGGGTVEMTQAYLGGGGGGTVEL